MTLPFYNWSRAAANNATADSTINWQEGQAPSSVNDSARAMMASTAAYRDDISGAIGTGGTSTAYTVTSFEIFDTFTSLNGKVIGFTPHVTNGGTTTLNVDGLGAKPLRQSLGVEIVAGTLIQGTPYLATYVLASDAFYLHDFYGNPYSIPIGGSLDFWGATAPNSSFVLMYGQAISRATYSTLFTLFSTTFGVGDGSTTFNIPDLRGRVIAGKDDMGGSAASRLSGTSITVGGATTLGGSGGAETKALATANLPAYTPAGSVAVSVTGITVATRSVNTSGSDIITTLSAGNSGGSGTGNQSGAFVSGTATGSFTGTAQGGTATAFAIAQPTIIANKLLRII